MTKLLLSVHVLAAIVAVGSITLAASLFPRYAKQSVMDGEDRRAAGVAAFLHRVCRGYAVAGLVVPVFGIATGAQLGVLGDAWLIVSMILTAVAAVMLAVAVIPHQQRLLAMAGAGTGSEGEAVAGSESGTAGEAGSAPEGAAAGEGLRTAAARLAMVTGVFNLLWAVVVVLMIVRPGSTTGV
ncbi:hypothetical protein LRS74_10400 [Streptomyces sp. LX-29]|uniref:hypothetical protein n=1 Tax=Streptomyces sp. LX-29 TaxID=2900152 RepID=UPI00240E7C76|nr:hypothetical protein [Streptomyces sp. LX-29]WFB07417.1 hypothetical protein LRS74_10400 [Streptomyces sp. LX-29]